jgi:hypothetical protein
LRDRMASCGVALKLETCKERKVEHFDGAAKIADGAKEGANGIRSLARYHWHLFVDALNLSCASLRLLILKLIHAAG